jgi:hypothetical protein
MSTTSNRPRSHNSHVPLPTRSKSGKANERTSKKRTREFFENINNSNRHYNQLLQEQKSIGKKQATTETVYCNDNNVDGDHWSPGGGFGGDFGGDNEDIDDVDDEEYWEDEDNAFEDLPSNSINDQYFEAYISATGMSESQYASDTRQRRVNWSKFVEATCSDVPFFDLSMYCNSETICACTKTKTEILGVSLEGPP